MRAAQLEITIAGRLVAGDFVKTADLTPATLPPGKIELVVESQSVPQGSDIFDLLTANGILPDVESFTLVYDLNPSLDKISPLPSGEASPATTVRRSATRVIFASRSQFAPT